MKTWIQISQFSVFSSSINYEGEAILLTLQNGNGRWQSLKVSKCIINFAKKEEKEQIRT